MSDGHFNRTFLTRNDYQSGYRAGYRVAGDKALAALQQSLAQHAPDLPDAVRETILAEVKARL